MFTSYSPIEYLCIDIANCVGKQGAMLGDKDTFENRIQWVKDNVDNLDDFIEVAEDKYQYMKAIDSLYDVMLGKPIGHTVALDAICSGISLMSAMTGCIKGCKATGLIDTGYRPDAYSMVTVEMNKILAKQGLHSVTVERSQAKQAMMTRGYGSIKKPEEIFGEDTPELKAFEEACSIVAPEAFKLMQDLIDAWQPYVLKHSFYMPDGFSVQLKTTQTIEKAIRVDELDDLSFTVHVEENKGTKKGVALCANTVHAVDAYVLRSMQRRCSFDVTRAEEALELINAELAQSTTPTSVSDKLVELVELWKATDIVDVRITEYLESYSIGALPKKLLTGLQAILSKMLEHGSFPVLTIHDAFRAHPQHCDSVRYWYKEICAELADSRILECIYSQLVGEEVKFNKAMKGIGKLIRESNYQLS